MTSFSVVAIVSAYNEADIIEQVVVDFIEQGVKVYLLDDGSTDATVNVVKPYVGRGVLDIEHVGSGPDGCDGGQFEWEQILQRKAKLSSELDAEWFIHNDADEFRESPWAGMTLASAIEHVDRLGYNAIDSLRLDFWPVHDRFKPGDDVRAAFPFYSVPAPYDRLQVRCWKRTTELVDLASSGGHEVHFAGRNVFPLPFLLRHYPIRSQAHGVRKVLQERRDRFSERERAYGWHIQYDGVSKNTSFIRDPATMTKFDADAIRVELGLRHRGVEDSQRVLAERDEIKRELSVARAESSQHAAEVLRVTHALGEARSAIESLRTALEERVRHFEELGYVANARQQEILRLGVQLSAALRRINELERSRSWRWTRPLRLVVDLLTGRWISRESDQRDPR